jgi:Zn finger protein HypA/HybF involved in hydrogenase expression
MGTAINWVRCNDCEEDFDVVLEWKSKDSSLDEIKKTKCPKCGSENWYFTDRMGQ